MTNVCVTIDTEGDIASYKFSTFLGMSVIVPKLLELFSKYNIKATFFIQEDEICQISSLFSELCNSLEDYGHEIGFHAHGLERATVEKKECIITDGIQRLRKFGVEPVSFRAGRYHFDGSVLKILEKNRIKYDSSVVPGLRECFSDGTVKCDHLGAPYQPYYPAYENHCKQGSSKVLELPINRYPNLLHHNCSGILAGGQGNEEVLFDYFYEIRKDQLIIINLHPWHGLSVVAYRFARTEKYGMLRKYALGSIAKLVSSGFLINRSYITRLDNLFRHISEKNNIAYTTIRAAGESIELQTKNELSRRDGNL